MPTAHQQTPQSPNSSDAAIDPLWALHEMMPDEVAGLLSPPPVTDDEDENRYWTIFYFVAREAQPNSPLEWLDIQLIVNDRWYEQRCVDLETALLKSRRRSALQNLLNILDTTKPIMYKKAELDDEMILAYLKSDPEAKKTVIDLLASFGLTESAITAESFASNINLLAAISHLANSRTARRQKAEAHFIGRRLAPQAASLCSSTQTAKIEPPVTKKDR